MTFLFKNNSNNAAKNLQKKRASETPKMCPKWPQVGQQDDPKRESIMEPKFVGLWERLRVSLERLGSVLGRLWGRLGGVLGRLGGVLGRLGRVLQASWAVSGASWSVLGASWGPLGASWAHVRLLHRFFNDFSMIFQRKMYPKNHEKRAPAAATVLPSIFRVF